MKSAIRWSVFGLFWVQASVLSWVSPSAQADSISLPVPPPSDVTVNTVPSKVEFTPAPPPAPPVQKIDMKLDGETVRYYIEAMMEGSPLTNPGGSNNLTADAAKARNTVVQSLLHEFLPHVRSVRLRGTSQKLTINILMDQMQTKAVLADADTANRFQLYELDAPGIFQYQITQENGVLTLEPSPGFDTPVLKIKIPVISDSVYLHRVRLDLASGQVLAEAGVAGDMITVFAKAKMYDKKFDGIDVSQTFWANAHYIEWLIFPIWTSIWEASS